MRYHRISSTPDTIRDHKQSPESPRQDVQLDWQFSTKVKEVW